jgi:hypothetical protein
MRVFRCIFPCWSNLLYRNIADILLSRQPGALRQTTKQKQGQQYRDISDLVPLPDFPRLYSTEGIPKVQCESSMQHNFGAAE